MPSILTSKKKAESGINNWAPDDRPREKLMHKGPAALSDAELLAIFIRIGRNNTNAVELAREILAGVDGDLHELARYSIQKLMKINGIGFTKAVSIVAALELGRRRQSTPFPVKPVIRDSRSVADYVRPHLLDNSHEVFGVLYLNQAGRVKHFELISKGGLSNTIADPKIIFKKAFEIDAASIALCHNHPSGDPKPSNADKVITTKLRQAAKLLDIKLIDHIIIGNNNYFSFADEGLFTP